MRTLFEPKDTQPQWQTIYNRIADMNIGDTITHTELADLLPGTPRSSRDNALHKAVRHLEDERSRTLANVRTVGYRMVEAAEHEDLARGQHKKAKRRLSAARRKLHSADRTRLTADERRRFDALEDHISRQQEMLRRLDARVARTETGLQEIRRGQREDRALMSERVDRLEDLLRRHGIADTTGLEAVA